MISVVATTYNEEASLAAFVRALLAQTLHPDEIVIADGGSTDATPAILRRLAAEHPCLHPLFLPHCHRSVGRNRAIAQAAGDVIAVTDAGTLAAPHWLERLTAPLRDDPSIDFVGGYYRAVATTPLQQAVAAATIVPPAQVDPRTFLPSSRSLAFRKTAWQAAGGYPEWLSVSEDTFFALALRQAGCRMAFAPDAQVAWELPRALDRVFRQFFHYARGDAQAGLFFRHYYKNYALLGGAAAWALGRRWPILRTLVSAGATAYLGKQCLRAARRTGSVAATALTPAVVLTMDLAHLAGYLTGAVEGPGAVRHYERERAETAPR